MNHYTLQERIRKLQVLVDAALTVAEKSNTTAEKANTITEECLAELRKVVNVGK